MTITFSTTGGVFRGGKMQGSGKIIIEEDNGMCSARIGNFIDSKLNDSSGIRVEFDDDRIIQYNGTFIDDLAEGNINVYEYEETADIGEGVHGNGSNNRFTKHIKNCVDRNHLNATKKVKTFSSGISTGELSSEPCDTEICVVQKKYNGTNVFKEFRLVEYGNLPPV